MSLILAIIASLMFYSCLFARYSLKIIEYDIPGLYDDILVLSDLHLRGRERLHAKLKNAVEKSDINTILCLGDIFEKVNDHDVLRIFDNKEVYSVLGNNDHGPGSRPERLAAVRDILTSHGVKILENENIKLENGWYIAGVDDPHKFKDDLKKAIKGIGENPYILLSHSPEILDEEFSDNKPFLTLYGHTHGGQVRLPILGSVFNNIRRGRITPHGLFKWKGMNILHTWGVGTTLFPFRFLACPEIVILRKFSDKA